MADSETRIAPAPSTEKVSSLKNTDRQQESLDAANAALLIELKRRIEEKQREHDESSYNVESIDDSKDSSQLDISLGNENNKALLKHFRHEDEKFESSDKGHLADATQAVSASKEIDGMKVAKGDLLAEAYFASADACKNLQNTEAAQLAFENELISNDQDKMNDILNNTKVVGEKISQFSSDNSTLSSAKNALIDAGYSSYDIENMSLSDLETNFAKIQPQQSAALNQVVSDLEGNMSLSSSNTVEQLGDGLQTKIDGLKSQQQESTFDAAIFKKRQEATSAKQTENTSRIGDEATTEADQFRQVNTYANIARNN